MKISRIIIIIALYLISGDAFSQTVIWSENFDGNVSNWVLENAPNSKTNPTPSGITGINTYGTNGSCNNYWVINSDHTPDYNNNYLGHRDICNNLPNPIANNKSLHITYQACAPVNGIEPAQPDGGDAYSWQGTQCNSEQWAYYNSDINTTNACDLYLEFWAYLGGDTNSLNNGYVDRSILYSTDGGATWKVLVEDLGQIVDANGNRLYDITTAGTCKQWQFFSIQLPNDANNIPNLRIAFRWRNTNPTNPQAGDYTTSSAFNIDDIKIVSRAFDADFKADQTTVCRNKTVTISSYFISQPPYNPLNPITYTYSWTISPNTGVTFVNGTTPSDANIQVQFANAGTYTITLTVTQNGGNCPGGSETITKTNYITVLPSCPPTASFTSNITKVCATNPTPTPGSVTEVQFTDLSSSEYPITSWNWNITGPGTVTFTGGTSSSSQNPTVSFDTPGLYTVQLTVTNQDGSDDTTITNYIEAVDCQCSAVGGGSSVITTTLDSVTFNSGSIPTNWSTQGGNSNNDWIVNNNYNTSTGSVPNQPTAIAGSPNSNYLHVTCNSFLCTFLFGSGWAVFYDDGSFITQTLYLYSDVYNVASYDSVKLSYWTTVAGGSAYGKCEYTIDGGATWTQLGPNLQSIGTWQNFIHNIDLLSLGNPNTIQFRWSFIIPNDGLGSDPPLCLDDIIIRAYQTGSVSGPNGVYTCPLATEFCEGDNVTITFNAIGTFNAGNQFIAQLSDANGSFASPTTLGSINLSGTNLSNQTITVTIPTPSQCNGTGYRIRVISTDPAYNSPPNVTDNGADITIKCNPQPFNITGNTSVCENSLETYTIPAQQGASYNWTVTGGTITSGQGTNTITVLWGTAGTATIYATVSNGCGSTTNNLTVNITSQPNTSAITGNTNICVNNSANYSVTNNAGSSYTWYVSGGGTITSGQNTNSITINWTTTGVYTVKVVEENGCGKDSSEITVIVNDVPTTPNITGSTSACPNDTIIYLVNPQPGASYNWTVTGGNILGGQGSNAITVEWTSLGTGTVSITITNNCGSANASINVTIGTNITISGFTPDSVCKTAGNITTATHSVNPIPGATYTWNILAGGTINSTNNNSVTIDWDNNATTHQVELTVSTPCGTAKDTFDITLIDPPALNPITGNTTVCVGATENYTTSLVGNNQNTTISWTLFNNLGTPTSGTGTTASITWNSTGTDTIIFTATNFCGTATQKLGINILNADPVSDITGNTNVCANSTETYSINNVPSATNYTWTLSGNGTITSGQGTNSITITWNSPGTATLSVSVQQSCGTITKDTTIFINDKPQLTQNNNPTQVCTGTSYDYSVSLANSSTNVSYNWYLTQNLGTPTSGNDSTANITWNSTGNDTIVFIATSSCGNDTIKIPITIENITFSATIDDSLLCVGQTFNYNTTGNYDNINIQFGDGNSDTNPTGSYSYSSDGNYTILFIAEKGQCKDTITKTIEVYPIPTITLSANPNPSFLPEIPTLSVSVQNTDTVKYIFGQGVNPIIQVNNFQPIKSPFNEPGAYLITAIATNKAGCSAQDTLTIFINEGIVIYIPNAFTPNGDGINDFFEIVETGLKEYTVNVYDRWGNLITTFGKNEKWDGTKNGTPVPEGTYVIVLQATGLDGKKYQRTATITIIR